MSATIAHDVIRLTLPDGSVREVPKGTTGRTVAESIGARLAKDALAVKLERPASSTSPARFRSPARSRS